MGQPHRQLGQPVYPRACGGTHNRRGSDPAGHGLSPRVRGNPSVIWRPVASVGSIPARAGEPWHRSGCTTSPWVYPRACGGTLPPRCFGPFFNGLSPRVRGNPGTGAAARPRHGSIPARAGEPCRRGASGRSSTVYPRACGGTLAPERLHDLAMGLSPRVRGNPAAAVLRAVLQRSIPARAGEPVSAGPPTQSPGVYPRACGGTEDRSG